MTSGETSTQASRRESKPQSNPGARLKPGSPQYSQYSRLLAIGAVFLLLISLFVAWDNPSVMQTTSPTQINTLAECGSPLKLIKDWNVQTFRPKWFGLFGEPGQITYRTWSRKARQISVVDLDKRDIAIRMRIDGRDLGKTDVALDPSVECGQDVQKCINMGFASVLILVPPGRHKVTAEIVKGDDGAFNWGGERKKRVMWNVQECS